MDVFSLPVKRCFGGMLLRHSFFVPKGDVKHDYYMIVIGNDIDSLTTQGYKNSGCHKGEEINHVTAEITGSEHIEYVIRC